MARAFTGGDLEAYLDEALAPEEMAEVEAALRERPELLKQLAAIHARRDAGVHSLGEIWRRRRASCPSREQLGRFLMKALDDSHAQYIQFHIELAGCRFCAANLADLAEQHQQQGEDVATRRRRIFETSAGYLRPKEEK